MADGTIDDLITFAAAAISAGQEPPHPVRGTLVCASHRLLNIITEAGNPPCLECGQIHGWLYRAGIPDQAEYTARFDSVIHPWKYADRPKVAHQWHLFPRARRVADTVEEIRLRLIRAWNVLAHDEEP